MIQLKQSRQSAKLHFIDNGFDMPVITADNISKSYADRLLFSGLNFSIEAGDRIGVVGINGTANRHY
jgi:ATPase subunit of ABC transporter with duplicated ATPase domains